MRELTYKGIKDYLQLLANSHIDIKEFIGGSADELENKLASFDSAESPFLFFYEYKNKLSGTTQRTFNQKTISFGICFSQVDANDYEAQTDAINACEIIGLEVLSRINLDSQGQSVKWLYNNFIKESAWFEPFEGEEFAGLYGMDFHFDLKVPEPLVVTPNKWTDGNTVCTG